MDAFKRGWSYTFIYMLRDSLSQWYWGFFHTDWTPKLSATDLHNLTTILADTSSDFTPGSLAYSIPNEPETVHDMLLQISNGTFELAVWDEKAKGTDTVTVNFGVSGRAIKVYDPTSASGAAPIKTLDGAASDTVTLSDHPVIYEIAAAPY